MIHGIYSHPWGQSCWRKKKENLFRRQKGGQEGWQYLLEKGNEAKQPKTTSKGRVSLRWGARNCKKNCEEGKEGALPKH